MKDPHPPLHFCLEALLSLCVCLDESSFFIQMLIFMLCHLNIVSRHMSFYCMQKLYNDDCLIFFMADQPFLFVLSLISCFQMTNTIQKKYKVSSTQLLYQSCPYQAATLLICGPYLDKLLTNLNVFAFKYTTQVTVRVKKFSLSFFFLAPALCFLLHFLLFFFVCHRHSQFFPALSPSLSILVHFLLLERHLQSPIRFLDTSRHASYWHLVIFYSATHSAGETYWVFWQP